MIFATCLERRGDAESADAYRKKVNRMLNRFTAFDRYDGNWMHTLAEAYAFSGDDERAIELLEIASERGVRYIDVLERRFFFGDLVDDPRFVAVLDEMRKDVDRMRAEVAKASINDDWYSILLIEPKDWLT